MDTRITERLIRLYGETQGRAVSRDLLARLADHPEPKAKTDRPRFSERDAVLISYGDSLRREGQSPLAALGSFAAEHLRETFSAIHLLPFFPYSSDDGFSVIDFHAVDPALGSWSDVAALGRQGFDLAFDFVLNHISSQSPWFRAYLAGDPQFAELALAVDPSLDLSAVTRPRALPLLSPYENAAGEELHLWTTFSRDQIDLNYENPAVLLRMIDVILDYVAKGATILRLDAVGFLWKEIGTSCIHLDETHEVVRLLRDVLDRVAPEVLLLSETNVPHAENISYFGDDGDEAQMVYNFSLPPLLLHALSSGDGELLSRWAASLDAPGDGCTFFNFTASHDGIGVRPLEGIAPQSTLDELAELAQRRGGRVSYRQRPDGGKSPYELNVTYIDALRGSDDEAGDKHHVRRFAASQAIAMSLPGVPATYIGSLLGNRNWDAGVEQTGAPRSINREKLDVTLVEAELAQPESFRARTFGALSGLLQARRQQPAFSPLAAGRVLDLGAGCFAIARQGGGQTLLALTNLRDERVLVELPRALGGAKLMDVLDGGGADATATLGLEPYQTSWLSLDGDSVPIDEL